MPYNACKVNHYGSGDFMTWVSIMLDGGIPQHVFERSTVTAERIGMKFWSPIFAFLGVLLALSSF